ncbi:MAG: hypothetical protein K0V04_40200 [Deltaproteobacteria bacterium]|nr:hypothetical protein [Deltaproteobacteria bacterium]
MNLSQARVVLRPRSQGEILDLAALWCFASDRWLYARLSMAVLLPSLAVCIFARTQQVEWGWVWCLAIAMATVSQGVFTVATARALFERNVSAGSVLVQYVKRLPSYVMALVITRAIVALSLLTVILVPGAWARIAFVHEASLLENGSPISATERAWRLGRGRSTEVIMLLGGLVLAIGAAIGAAEVLGHGIIEFVLQLGRPFGALLDEGGSIYALVGFHLVIPYLAVARFLGYVDRRTRGDGWDIQLRFMGLASAPDDRRRRS